MRRAFSRRMALANIVYRQPLRLFISLAFLGNVIMACAWGVSGSSTSYQLDANIQNGGVRARNTPQSNQFQICDLSVGQVMVAPSSRQSQVGTSFLNNSGFFNAPQFGTGADFITIIAPIDAGATSAQGYAPPGEMISLVDSTSNVVLGTGRADANGSYVISLTSGLLSNQSVYAIGSESALKTGSATVRGFLTAGSDAPKISLPLPADATAIVGTALPDTSITLYDIDRGRELGSATSDASGQWTLLIVSSDVQGIAGQSTSNLTIAQRLVVKTNSLSGSVVSVSGVDCNGGSVGATIQAPVPSGSIAVSGTAPAASSVQIIDPTSGAILGLTVAGSDGTYTASLGSAIRQSQYLVAINNGTASGIVNAANELGRGGTSAPEITDDSHKPLVAGQNYIQGSGPTSSKVYIYKPDSQSFIGYGYLNSAGNFDLVLSRPLQLGETIIPMSAGISGTAIRVNSIAEPSLVSRPVNYPNPFNPNAQSTTIKYDLTMPSDIGIWIYDLTGQVVRILDYNQNSNGGWASASNLVNWDGKDDWGQSLSTGVYLYRVVQKSSGQKPIGKGKIAILRQ